MRPNPQIPADLLTFVKVIPNGKLHFLCSIPYCCRVLGNIEIKTTTLT